VYDEPKRDVNDADGTVSSLSLYLFLSQAADADGSDGIEMDEFIEHFGDLLGASLSEVRARII
jgi:hypothetical protein